MPQFIITPKNIKNNQIFLTKKDEDFHHIFNVLRKKIDDELNFLSTDNLQYLAKVETINKNDATLKVLKQQATKKTDYFVLFQCLPKNKKMDFIIEKAVELGVDKIVPVYSQNVMVKDVENKTERWQEIAIAAVKQSGNPTITQISEPQKFGEIIKNFDPEALNLIGYEHSENDLKITKKQKVNLIIGAEGGFDEKEIATATKLGWQDFRLKGNILRAETAPIVLISIIKNQLGLL